jgi:hypothetical protein
MIIDNHNTFSDAQALTATAVSTNVIDLGKDGNIGIGEEMAVQITLDVAADGASTDETYSVDVQTDDNVGFSSAASLGTFTIARGSAAGTKKVFIIPKDTSAERYLRLNYTLGGTTPAVTLTAVLVPAKFVEAYVTYPDGFTIS